MTTDDRDKGVPRTEAERAYYAAYLARLAAEEAVAHLLERIARHDAAHPRPPFPAPDLPRAA